MLRYIIVTPQGPDYDNTYKNYQAARYWKKKEDSIQRVIIKPYTKPKEIPPPLFITDLHPKARPNNTPRSKKGKVTNPNPDVEKR